MNIDNAPVAHNKEEAPMEGNNNPEARSVAAERGLGWWTDAWALFMRSALLWVALALILFLCMAVVGMVPVLGGVAITLALPVFLGSWVLAAHKVHEGGTLEVADLFAAFKGERLTPLLVIGALLLAATLVMFLVAMVLGAGAVFGVAMGGARQSAAGLMAAVGAGFAALVVCLVLGAIVTMALWFAPALVVFRNVPPVEALKQSATAVLKNWVAFLVFGLLYIVASIVATIPFGLGWLVLLPVSLLTAYVSYRDTYEMAA